MNLLEIVNMEVKFSKIILILKGLSLNVSRETIVALLGSNGAGKSTTLKSISGLLDYEDGEVTRGDIIFQDKSLLQPYFSSTKRVRMGIIQVFEGRRIFDELTVEENLMIGSYTRSDKKKVSEDIAMIFDYFPALRERAKNTAGYLSGGEQQMLALGRALTASPKIILLDEPSLGLSPRLAKEVFKIIDRVNKEQKITILLVEQNAKLAFSIADYAYVMENGRIVIEGSVRDLEENRNIQEFYVGLSQTGMRKSFKEVKHYKRLKRWFSA
ncbi:MAG: ABC transporter ATP-binding protein [Deltaproteobacteria bacterium]|nr:ABC transporter ATP-binding protein [Deltaproteobacteria bacterium]